MSIFETVIYPEHIEKLLIPSVTNEQALEIGDRGEYPQDFIELAEWKWKSLRAPFYANLETHPEFAKNLKRSEFADYYFDWIWVKRNNQVDELLEKIDSSSFHVPTSWFDDYSDDIYVSFKCKCGNEIHFSEGGRELCVCGRAYRLTVEIDQSNELRKP